MHGEPMARNMFKDALISRWRTALVMLRRQSVHRDHQMQFLNAPPLRWNWPDRTRDDLNLDTHFRELGKQDSQLVVANQRLATHNRDVNRLEAADQGQHPGDQGFPSVIVKQAQRATGPQMALFVSVAAGTT